MEISGTQKKAVRGLQTAYYELFSSDVYIYEINECVVLQGAQFLDKDFIIPAHDRQFCVTCQPPFRPQRCIKYFPLDTMESHKHCIFI